MKTSKRVSQIQPSLTRKLFNMAKEYDDVIDLTLGDPDLNTPDYIKQAGCKAIMQNQTKYSANAGLAEVRAAVKKRVTKLWGVSCDPAENVIVTVGGMEALYLSLACMIDNGDEVIVFAPYYVNYIQMIKFCEGKPIIIEAYSETEGMVIDEQRLRESITDKTVAIIINSPNNPTGSVLSKDDLKKIATVAQEYDLTIISDEVYRSLIFDGKQHQSILQFPEAQGRTVLIDSMSKEFCMTGWRIGFAYAPAELIKNMVKLQENVAACASLPSQYAMEEAYNNPTADKSEALEIFQQRRDFLYEKLSRIPGLHCVKPEATFYLFLNISATGMTSYDFACQLLQCEQVAVVPGESYGQQYTGYVRIAFTKDIPVLLKAVERIHKFIMENKLN